MWASSPHLRSKRNFAISGFPAAIALFETSQFGIGCFYETSCKFRQGNGAIAARWQAKAGVEPPFAGCGRPFSLKAVFHVKHGSWETTRIRFGKAGAHPQLALGIAIAPETLYFITTFQFLRQLRFFRFSLRFLLHFIVQFCYLLRKCGLLAHISPTFLKNCWIKKLFILPAARILQPLPASPKNFPFCAFLPLSAFPPHFLFPSHASCPFSSNASALYPLFIAKYLINPLRFSSKLLLSKRIFATFQRQS